jgi:hypothetical protein
MFVFCSQGQNMAYPKFSDLPEPTPRRGLLNIPPPWHGRGNHGHYDPNQPRVPPGHHDGGQWTRDGQSGAGLFPNGIPDNAWPLGAQPEDQNGVEFFSDLVPDNAWTPRAQYAAGGNENNIQHQKGVEAAKQELLKLGYSVIEEGPVAVDVPGFATPRFYDLIVRHPDTGHFVVVEVKTTLSDTIFLNPRQIAKDAVVMASAGQTRLSSAKIEGVYYLTYCRDCEKVDLRSNLLRLLLDTAKIPYTQGNRPGRKLP